MKADNHMIILHKQGDQIADQKINWIQTPGFISVINDQLRWTIKKEAGVPATLGSREQRRNGILPLPPVPLHGLFNPQLNNRRSAISVSSDIVN
ncbi:MAG: hypothetical protein QNJ63_10195 [Calothrix sp. MO_192.B10]|nr:hypothetical protein [Calothrix sp. MO_192.B10]